MPINYPLTFLCVAAALVSTAGAQVINDTAPEAVFINQQYNAGLAAGNSNDWYLNCDGNHANVITSDFLTINRYPDNTAGGTQTGVRDAPRNILGNASLGVGGLWSMTRYYLMSSYNANRLYTQYRSNQHFFYPAVRDTQFDDPIRDLTFALYPYVTMSVGKSGSEKDEVRKFFLAMAAYRPEVKTILEDEGLLIPTTQMIFRRTRVDSDVEYLTSEAHPSAFADVSNDLAMVQMANEITTDKIPPLVQLEVLDENFAASDPNGFNDAYVNTSGEHVFTTPNAVGRIWRGPEHTKTMTVSVANSIDVNDLDLTYEFVVLRGDPSKVTFTPLNGEGSEMKIDIDYFETFTEPHTGELSNMLVIGVFAHNGHYYSAPTFITCSTLWNESRTYDSNDLLSRIDYSNEKIENNVSYDRAWLADVFEFDLNDRVYKLFRDTGSSFNAYIREGYLVIAEDDDGLPTQVTQVSYSSNYSTGVSSVAPTYTSDLWYYAVDVLYESLAIPVPGSYQYVSPNNDPSFSTVLAPQSGQLSIQYAQGGNPPGFTYTPEAGFTGLDFFTVREYNSVAQETILRKYRVVVGPADVTAPAQVTGLQVVGESIEAARLLWERSADNYGIRRYVIHRDGVFHGYAYQEEYLDDSVVPGTNYDYTVYAEDDAGNLSVISATVSGGGAAIYGQDNFNDNKYLVADPALQNCLTWTLLSGSVTTTSSGSQKFRLGVAATQETYIITNQSITPPFTMDYRTTQQYCTAINGPILLYQDADNYYHLTINRDVCELYRRMDGVDTLLGSDDNVAMNLHASSNARYQITVTATGGLIAFNVVKSEWSNSPGSVYQTFFYDDNPAAVALFTEGVVGFKQLTLGSYNVAIYDDLFLSREDGEGRDLDGDGLIDAWEIARFGGTSNPNAAPGADPDNDGVSTEDEQLWGTNPMQAGSSFRPNSVHGFGADIALSWPSIPGRLYTVMSSTDLIHWDPVQGMIDMTPTPPNNTVEFDLPANGPEFYTIEVQAAP